MGENRTEDDLTEMVLKPGNHGMVVVHGVADTVTKGDLLASVTNSLADVLLDSPVMRPDGASERPVIRREADLSAETPSVTLSIETPDGKEASWVCKEAFWAEAFPPPSAPSVFKWLLGQQMVAQLRYVWKGLKDDPANNEDFHPPTPGKTEPHWRSRGLVNFIYRLELAALGILLLPLSVIVPLLLVLIWPLYWLPRFGFLAGFLNLLHSLDPFLSRVLGDIKRYIEHGVWAANARGILEDIVIGMLEGRHGEMEDVTIVAHSLGAVVAYDALAEGGRIADLVAGSAAGQAKRITLVTVGSGINQVFKLVRGSNLYARTQFDRPLAAAITGGPQATAGMEDLSESRFYWLDIYARFDPVPAGDLDDDIISRAQVDPRLVKRRRVINFDNPVRDHTHYWQNRELVMPRIARAVNGGEYPWPAARITQERVRRRIRGVATLGLLRLLIALVVIASLVVAGLQLVDTIPGGPMAVPEAVAVIAIGIYQLIRSRKFGDIT